MEKKMVQTRKADWEEFQRLQKVREEHDRYTFVGYSKMPAEVVQKTLPDWVKKHGARLANLSFVVLCYLQTLVNRCDRSLPLYACFPSREKICNDLGIRNHDLSKCFNILRESKLLYVTRGGGTTKRGNIYIPFWVPYDSNPEEYENNLPEWFQEKKQQQQQQKPQPQQQKKQQNQNSKGKGRYGNKDNKPPSKTKQKLMEQAEEMEKLTPEEIIELF